MSRRNAATRREVLPDPRFGSVTLNKFINRMMLDGKKSIAERIVYEALDVVAEQMKHQVKKEDSADGESGSSGAGSAKLTPVDYLELALENLRPMVEVRSRRVGGATYQVPVEVRPERRDTLAMRWLVIAARQRSEKGMVKRLAGEIIDAIGKRGAAYKKLDDVIRMAKANQAFVHFRWT